MKLTEEPAAGLRLPSLDGATAIDLRAANPRFPEFDILRAIAALSIVVFHVTQDRFLTGALAPYTGHLNSGVALFFALSGFVLYRPFVAARLAGTAPAPMGQWFKRRAFRIVPAYWAVLLIAGAYPGLTGVYSRNAWAYFGFVQTYLPRRFSAQGLNVAWSLCTEVTFYLLLPVYAAIMTAVASRLPIRRWARLELAILVVLSLGSVAFHDFVSRTSHADLAVTLPGTVYLFAVGMGLAVLSAVGADDPGLDRLLRILGRRRWLWWALAAISLLALGAAGKEVGPTWPGYAIPAALLLAPVVAKKREATLRGAAAGLGWVGLVSYGVYLWHRPVLATFADLGALDLPSWLRGPLVLAAAAAVSCALAAASYYTLERFFLSRARRTS